MTIKDIAEFCGVSVSTVSRVLNGTANVAPETRMKIEQAMKELNYIPNELARSMFKQKAGIVAMLVPDIRQMCGARISTLDFVFSQGSGNAAFCIWMLILYFSSKTFWAAKTKNI